MCKMILSVVHEYIQKEHSFFSIDLDGSFLSVSYCCVNGILLQPDHVTLRSIPWHVRDSVRVCVSVCVIFLNLMP